MASGELKEEIYKGRNALNQAEKEKFERMIIYLKDYSDD